ACIRLGKPAVGHSAGRFTQFSGNQDEETNFFDVRDDGDLWSHPGHRRIDRTEIYVPDASRSGDGCAGAMPEVRDDTGASEGRKETPNAQSRRAGPNAE